jgi:hypothetical protein
MKTNTDMQIFIRNLHKTDTVICKEERVLPRNISRKTVAVLAISCKDK